MPAFPPCAHCCNLPPPLLCCRPWRAPQRHRVVAALPDDGQEVRGVGNGRAAASVPAGGIRCTAVQQSRGRVCARCLCAHRAGASAAAGAGPLPHPLQLLLRQPAAAGALAVWLSSVAAVLCVSRINSLRPQAVSAPLLTSCEPVLLATDRAPFLHCAALRSSSATGAPSAPSWWRWSAPPPPALQWTCLQPPAPAGPTRSRGRRRGASWWRGAATWACLPARSS